MDSATSPSGTWIFSRVQLLHHLNFHERVAQGICLSWLDGLFSQQLGSNSRIGCVCAFLS